MKVCTLSCLDEGLCICVAKSVNFINFVMDISRIFHTVCKSSASDC